MTTALIYVRQSRHKEGERTVSPEVQFQACGDLAAVKACNQVERYEDLDKSGGKKRGRVGYLAMLERIQRAPKGDGLVIALYDQSRAFRNTADALEFFALLEKRPWIDVALVYGRFDRSPAGGFTYTTLAAAHEMERRMTGEKIRAAYAYRNAQGAPTGPVPFGLKRTGSRADGTVDVDEERAEIVRRLYREYSTGSWSIRSLAAHLNSGGAPGPGRAGWQSDTLLDMLQNVAYIGLTYSGGRRRREGQLVPAQWPAIIDRSLWDAVQAQLKRNRRAGGHAGIGKESRYYTFQRLLVCSCGRHMNARHYSRPNYAYYKCRGADASGTCSAGSVREVDLLPWAQELFERLDSLQPAELAGAVRSAVSAGNRQTGDGLKQVETRLERIAELYAMGHWEKSRYLVERKRLEDLRAQFADVAPATKVVPLRGLLDGWNRGDARTRHELLAAFFEAIHIEDGRIVACTPRRERAAEIVPLLEAIQEPVGVRSRSGAGGI